ncbi:hypothetical protein [Dactylosporangium matsuzakiense]|uniref:Uncharacterized protein n=1 Tax=Dactylosporangium matsuzakiense TaxID=53360 RepID=A0A9W6NSK9_9ACTN|nr:hypothetical protein [Dactylosporangium matsuzakiense]UWZ41179.1 hypothetical protein Dmats_26100 [Dactylosporangium matsuzakiense]GLL08470.1 hypothetical protein GCM10017581_102340 [Dactylosporangium matsuzakiense]
MRLLRILLLAGGLALVAYGVSGWVEAPVTELAGRLAFAAAVLVAHDFVVVPLVLAVGALVTRYIPAPARTPARAALIIAAAVSAVALPFVIGAGRIADNPSAFPQHYGRNLLLILAIVAAVTGAWIAAGWLRRRGRAR